MQHNRLASIDRPPSAAGERVLQVLEEQPATTKSMRPAGFLISEFMLITVLLGSPWAFGAVQTRAWVAMLLLALIALMGWAVGCVQSHAIHLYGSPMIYPAVGFLALAAIQFFGGFTADRIATREALLNSIACFVLFFLTMQLLATTGKKTLLRFGLTTSVLAFVMSLFAILQFFSSQGNIYWAVKSMGWTFGPYVNHNHYAGLMEMLIPISAGYVLSRTERDPRRMMLALLVLLPVASLLLSSSRGGFLSLLAEIAILGVLLWVGRFTSRSRVTTPMLFGIVAAAVVFFWLDPGSISKRLASVATVHPASEAGLGERLTAAGDTLRIFQDYPALGTGLGSFPVVFPRYQTFASDRYWDHAHNDYAELLAGSGLVGGLLALAALILFFRLSFKHALEPLRDPTGWIQLGAAIGCCGLLVHSFVDFNLHIPANAAWFVVCVAIGTSAPKAAGSFRSSKNSMEAQTREDEGGSL